MCYISGKIQILRQTELKSCYGLKQAETKLKPNGESCPDTLFRKLFSLSITANTQQFFYLASESTPSVDIYSFHNIILSWETSKYQQNAKRISFDIG